MNQEQYFPPKLAKGQFHCPHCGVFAKQRWSHLTASGDVHTVYWSGGQVKKESSIYNTTPASGNLPDGIVVSICEHCNKLAIWVESMIIYPKKISVAAPNKDLTEDIQKDYLEAARIIEDSPRSAAAILRLALQKLCRFLGEPGKNINDDIASLVRKGLNPSIKKSLDALRITGNNAVHPGELDLYEDHEKVSKLFGLLNFVAEKMISEPKEIEEFYDSLPTKDRQAVDTRDKA